MTDSIRVAVRMRPLIKREKESKASVHWMAEGSSVAQKNQPSNKFQFDRVFREIDTNDIVYAEFCSPLVESVIDGFNGTIFAYGQTSSGKTFTLMGKDDGKELGIAHHTVSDIFNHIQNRSEREFLLRVSYMEIYNESVFDLLSDDSKHMKLVDREGLIKVSGLTEHIVQTSEQVLQLMRKGEKKRKIGNTNMNERSSRSHSIFQVIIESRMRGDDDSAVNVSQFNLVDLAGSERVAQTGAKEERLTESKFINRSLLMLSQVIRQLSEKPDQYVNYRDSKLTRILQNSLGGNARTAIICTITPATVEETLSSLKFATQAKRIRNKPQVNEVLTEQALLKRYANEIKELTKELETTKEEKDQENKSLKEQILSLRNKFVSQMAPEKRSARRETWGGCLDATRFKMPFLPPLKKNSLDPSLIPEQETSRRTGSYQGDLSTVDEENEVEAFDGTFLSRSSKQPSVRLSRVTTPYSERGVQTDISSVERLFSDPEEQVMNLQAVVKILKTELAELKEFTSLEKQYFAEYNLKKSGNESLAGGTPQRNVLRFSLGDEDGDSVMKSSTPIKHSQLQKEILFEYLNDTIKVLGKCTRERTKNLNTQDQVLLNLFGLVLQHQCSKVKGNEYLLTKSSDALEALHRILSRSNDKSLLHGGMIEEFTNKTNDLLKEMEIFSLDFDDEKASTGNDVVLVDVAEASRSFDVSVTKPLNLNGDPEVASLKSRVAALEKDVASHLKTISELQEDIELKNEELQLQNEIAECLKDELSAKDKVDSRKTVQDTCAGEKFGCSSQTSYLQRDDTNEEKLNCSSQTSYIDENAEKLSLLNGELCKGAKIISDLEYERDSRDKQIALCEDKIRIQEQIILSLQSEISLRAEENVPCGRKPLYVNSSSQTFYFGDLSQIGHGGDDDDGHEISLFEDTSLNHDKEAEHCPEQSPIKNVDPVDGSCAVFSENPPSVDAALEMALKEFTDLKRFAVEFMERNMDEVYFRSVCDSSETPASVQDSIRVESSTVRKLLQRVEFYLVNKREIYEHFQDVLSGTCDEVAELKSQLSDAESRLKRTEGEMLGLHEAFEGLRSGAAVFLEAFGAPKSLEWGGRFPVEAAGRARRYVSLLKRVNEMLVYFVEERKSLSGKTDSMEVAGNSSSSYVSRAIQTLEDERLARMSKELDTLKAEEKRLMIEVGRLNSTVETIKKLRDEDEGWFKGKESRYKTEIQNLRAMFETQKGIWTENASKCVESVEEKYDQLMNEQEVRFCEELNSAKDRNKELIAMLEKEVASLKKDHSEKMTRVHDKLSGVMTAHHKEYLEAEKTIGDLKKDAFSLNEANAKLRYKCKSYATELHQLRASAKKSTGEVGVQAALDGKRGEASNVATRDVAAQASTEKTSDGESAAALARKNEALRKEIASLNHDVASKVRLLRSCHCRTIPPALAKNKPTGEKISESEKNSDQAKEAEKNKRGELIFASAAEVLQSDFVKRAIELEVERDKYKLSDSGTASTLANVMLKKDLCSRDRALAAAKKDLGSRDRALAAAKKEIAELKAYANRRNALPVKENINFPSSEDVTEYNRENHPYHLGEVPKLPTKNMLKEKYQVPRINLPTANKRKDEKDVLSDQQAKEEFKLDFNRRSNEPECNQQ